jgi:hypothetical protein
MKRNVLLKHLKDNNCILYREGKRHSVYINKTNGNMATVPRHADISELTALSICKQLNISKY